ncbi:MAG: class I SAM-dependent methyltransferase [Cyanobacteriota bacterium]|nr:class I SAM-dependent methyltransferase [Cyanobacteriota bacterium]
MTSKPLWETLLQPFFQTFLIDQEELGILKAEIDWPAGLADFGAGENQYPDYYSGSNFHGIEGGYLTQSAALTYDPITRYVLPPNEDWVRQGLINRVGGAPRRILDLGCGTGTQTRMLKRAFSQAEVTGLDLSPYMLTFARHQAAREGLTLQWRQGRAEKTPFSAESFDLITAALLFHETPPPITEAILKEAFRLLKPGGQILILDGNQQTLRRSAWLTRIFEEPYIQDYAQGDLLCWLRNAGFEAAATYNHWQIHQVTEARKPQPIVLTPTWSQGFAWAGGSLGA